MKCFFLLTVSIQIDWVRYLMGYAKVCDTKKQMKESWEDPQLSDECALVSSSSEWMNGWVPVCHCGWMQGDIWISIFWKCKKVLVNVAQKFVWSWICVRIFNLEFLHKDFLEWIKCTSCGSIYCVQKTLRREAFNTIIPYRYYPV